MNYRQAWAEGDIEAGALLDAIEKLQEEIESLKAHSKPVASLVRSRHMSTPARLAHDGKDHFTPWGEWEPCTLAFGEAVTNEGRNTPRLYEMRPLILHHSVLGDKP